MDHIQRGMPDSGLEDLVQDEVTAATGQAKDRAPPVGSVDYQRDSTVDYPVDVYHLGSIATRSRRSQ